MATIGRYELVSQLASGNTGYVYSARLPDMADGLLAIKAIKPRLAQEARFAQLLLSEAAAAIRFSHLHAGQLVAIAQTEAGRALYDGWTTKSRRPWRHLLGGMRVVLDNVFVRAGVDRPRPRRALGGLVGRMMRLVLLDRRGSMEEVQTRLRTAFWWPDDELA